MPNSQEAKCSGRHTVGVKAGAITLGGSTGGQGRLSNESYKMHSSGSGDRNGI